MENLSVTQFVGRYTWNCIFPGCLFDYHIKGFFRHITHQHDNLKIGKQLKLLFKIWQTFFDAFF